MPFKSAWETRTNWTNGQVPAQADFNANGDDIRFWGGNVSAEGHNLTNVGTISQDSWTVLTPLNSWVNFGAPYPTTTRAMLDKQGIVNIVAVLTGGTITDATTIFTLPSALRNTSYQVPATVIATANVSAVSGFAQLAIDTSGVCKIYGVPAGHIYLFINVRFPTF